LKKEVEKMQAKIEKVKAREILDSRGNPTIEVDLMVAGGFGVGQLFLRGLRPENTRPLS